ncbi:hypothetical protein BCR34DRAFT_595875 [Clohesyomyces aquaticus]|uniref:Uncharacterized protein n=1 Tax=Clohesyomyces aquaticus TaxID=1231657 RepID=A0A1Y2A954_9PLEO|nr:hypothetical protein BCR34DRAFT_595875 [Clohesyomyces aquaticus]
MSNDSRILPWTWSITADDPSKCPSPSAILGTFAAVNVLVSVLAVITGHRLVVKFCTFGKFGNHENSWTYMWLVSLGTQLGANVLVGYLIQRASGFSANYSIGDLVLLYTARPRLSFLVLSLLSLVRNDPYDQKTSYWHSSAMSQMIAEIILEFVALAVVGRAVHFGVVHQFYHIGSDSNGSLSSSAKTMARGDEVISGTLHTILVYTIFSFGLFNWVSSWVFWAGYVKTAGTLYCPPKLLEQGVVWTSFSIIGIFTSGAA